METPVACQTATSQPKVIVKDFRIPLRSVWRNPGNRGQRGRRLIRALNWQLSKRLRPGPRTLHLANGAFFRAHSDCVVSSSLVYADWPEFHEIMFIRKTLEPGDAAIDIGANVGHILLAISDMIPPSELFAFEPTPVSFDRLRENWLLNRWPTDNLYQIAIGEAAGTMYIKNTSTPTTTNALETEQRECTIPVRVAPLDSLIDLWRGLTIGLLKIDVEGFERAVFRGARIFFQTFCPKLVMFESLDRKLDPEIGDVLGAAGYRVFQLDAKGKPEFGIAEAQNLFAAPRALLTGSASN